MFEPEIKIDLDLLGRQIFSTWKQVRSSEGNDLETSFQVF